MKTSVLERLPAAAPRARGAGGAARRRRARRADRARAQDAARLLARPARGFAAPGVAAADAALLRCGQAALSGLAGARVDAGLCATGQPPRHLADQVGAGGPG